MYCIGKQQMTGPYGVLRQCVDAGKENVPNTLLHSRLDLDLDRLIRPVPPTSANSVQGLAICQYSAPANKLGFGLCLLHRQQPYPRCHSKLAFGRIP